MINLFGFANDQPSKTVGEIGEDLATRFLKKKGLRIRHRNWYNPRGKRLGEIDIVAENGSGHIIFVEVKTRVTTGTAITMPEEQITPAKLFKMRRVAELYITHFDLWDRSWQCDAVAISLKNEVIQDIKHIENIFI